MTYDLSNLEIYKLAIELSNIAWKIYYDLPTTIKYHTGGQFLDSTDSVGANIAEGYRRFHYLDRIKFLYNARGSLLESNHWLGLLSERNLIKNKALKNQYINIYNQLIPKLNNFINSTYKQKEKNS